MTRLARAVRNLLERLLGHFHEGPQPPRRISEEVRLFAALHPDASAADWVAFTTHFARRQYADGYVRGWEYNERCWPGPIDDPASILAAESAQVSLADSNPRLRSILELGYDPMDPFGGVPPENRKAFLEKLEVGRWPGGVRRGRR